MAQIGIKRIASPFGTYFVLGKLSMQNYTDPNDAETPIESGETAYTTSNFLPTAFLMAFLMTTLVCYAQYTEEQLYYAYLHQDMSVWRNYIENAKWEKMSVGERKQLINYEYGFIATAIDAEDPKADEYLTHFRQHVAEEYDSRHISEAHYCMYMSSINAYDFMLNKSKLFSAGLQSFKLVKKAAQLAPDDPFVLTLKANVDFYAPAAFGGDKEAALVLFTRARELFRETEDYQHLWNYASLRLCIAQCYDKKGDSERAISECYSILGEIPDFEYVRDEYLPQLLAKQK